MDLPTLVDWLAHKTISIETIAAIIQILGRGNGITGIEIDDEWRVTSLFADSYSVDRIPDDPRWNTSDL